MPNLGRTYWVSAVFALLVAVLFWFGFNCQSGRLYAPYPYHRLQSAALLDGHLSLSSSLGEIDHGLTWHNDQVNQVWGLGVALWMLPFELIYRALGASPCPDRVPLLALMALFAVYALRGGGALASALKSRIAGMSFVYLVVLFPPLWNLILGRQLVFQETILYACLISTALLVGVVRFLLLQQRADFWIVCVLGGLSGLMRVTHGLYGAVAGLVCGFVMLRSATRPVDAWERRDSRKIWEPLLGCAMLLAGFVFLAWSNYTRYGSVTECGHRLTNHTIDVNYLTRFGNPFANTGVVAAGRELFSWLFLSPFHRDGSGSEDWLPWQAATLRWRGVEQATFDPSCLLILLAACLLAGSFLCSRVRRHGCASLLLNKPLQRLTTGLLIWFLGSALGLALFYLYAPIITTRYILDFAPSFLAAFVLVLLLLIRRWPRAVAGLFLIWTCGEFISLGQHSGESGMRGGLSKEELSGLPVANGAKISSFEGRYSLPSQPDSTGIKYNGSGWEADGTASSVVTLAVDCPQFLEIYVGQRYGNDGLTDSYQAKIDNIALPLVSCLCMQDGDTPIFKIRFRIPEQIERKNSDQLVFVCFVNGWDTNERQSHRLLHEIRWK